VKKIQLRTALAAGSALAAIFALTLPAWALSVTVDGQMVGFSPPPIERAGRVFVPLRGVFQRLGATVVYSNGVINATGDGRNVSLTIGSTSATVNGQSQTLDQAPFIIGASTYVPLRFISESLGVIVNYDANNQIVALVTNSGPPEQGPPPQGGPPRGMMRGDDSVILTAMEPAQDSQVRGERPTISANFTRRVDPNSLHVTLDGLDITGDATRSLHGIVYQPNSPLESTRHTVEVDGNLADGQSFHARWHFTSGT